MFSIECRISFLAVLHAFRIAMTLLLGLSPPKQGRDEGSHAASGSAAHGESSWQGSSSPAGTALNIRPYIALTCELLVKRTLYDTTKNRHLRSYVSLTIATTGSRSSKCTFLGITGNHVLQSYKPNLSVPQLDYSKDHSNRH